MGIIIRNSLNKMMIFASIFLPARSGRWLNRWEHQILKCSIEIVGSLENLLGYLKEGFDGNKEFKRIDN